MIFVDGKALSRPLLWRMTDYLWGIFPALTAICVCVALWQYGHDQLGELVLPAPEAVIMRITEIIRTGSGRVNIGATLWRAGIGIALALTCGIAGGLLAGASRTLALLTRPVVTVLLGMPPIVWVVLALFWFGMGSISVMFTVWVAVLPLVFAAAQMSLLTVPAPLAEMMRIYRISPLRRLRYLYLPHIVRHLLSAVIVAVGSGLKITVMAELLGSNTGMGSAIANARAMLDTTDVMAYVVIIVMIIMLIEYGILEPIRRFFTAEQR